MKTIVTMALSVMLFTGVMAQQKSKQASFKAKNNEEVLLTKKRIEASQAANAEMTLQASDVKSKAEAQKTIVANKLKEQKEFVDASASDAEASTISEFVINGKVTGDANGAEIGTTAQSNVIAEVQSITAGSATSVENRGNGAIIAASQISSGLNSHIKSISSDIKTEVKVITDINVKPKSINARIKAATGIKL